MPEWFSGDVNTNGLRMHYYRTGGEKPPLVLAHGASDSGLCWTRVARTLAAEYDVILPDARGHGLSDAPENGYSSSDHAADLAGFIEALGLKRPAVGGHSMGAGAVLRLIADHPDLVRCAILEDPGFRTGQASTSKPSGESPRDAIRRNVELAKKDGLEATISRGRAESPTWAEEEFEPWADAKMHVSEQFLATFGRAMAALEWRELLPRVTCPVLLVTSDPERGAIVTPETAEEARHLLPSLRVVRLRGAGHNIRREQFDGFVDAVREFLVATAGAAARPLPQASSA
jgi:N-formylmaleamate deformylase